MIRTVNQIGNGLAHSISLPTMVTSYAVIDILTYNNISYIFNNYIHSLATHYLLDPLRVLIK